MSVTIRDKKLDKRIARIAREKGRISKTAVVVIAVTEYADRFEQSKSETPPPETGGVTVQR